MELMRRMSKQTLWQMSRTCVSILMSSVKRNPLFLAVVENDMTLCPNERDGPFISCVDSYGRIRRHSILSSFNCNLFSIIQFLIS